MKALRSLALALALAGCATTMNSVEFGGVRALHERPANTVDCNMAKASGLTLVHRGHVTVPRDVHTFFYLADQRNTFTSAVLTHDITPEGIAANIRFSGPPDFLEHTTRQKLVRIAADMLQASRYEWSDQPAYATGCAFQLLYLMQG